MRLLTTSTSVITTARTLPDWLEYAIKGEKINAIKALREQAGLYSGRQDITLFHAKNIVESVMKIDAVHQGPAELSTVTLVG